MRLPDIAGRELHAQLKSDPQFAPIPVVIYSAGAVDKPPQDAVAYVRKADDPDTLLDAPSRRLA
jgi:CheY-like chemotaxis protein